MVLLASNMYVKTFRINRNKQVIKLLDKPSDKLTIHFFFFLRGDTSASCPCPASCMGDGDAWEAVSRPIPGPGPRAHKGIGPVRLS